MSNAAEEAKQERNVSKVLGKRGNTCSGRRVNCCLCGSFVARQTRVRWKCQTMNDAFQAAPDLELLPLWFLRPPSAVTMGKSLQLIVRPRLNKGHL